VDTALFCSRLGFWHGTGFNFSRIFYNYMADAILAQQVFVAARSLSSDDLATIPAFFLGMPLHRL
jgi:uncharacterized membrane protein YbhN (UPF0104 family)